jgi:hypothetical protein
VQLNLLKLASKEKKGLLVMGLLLVRLLFKVQPQTCWLTRSSKCNSLERNDSRAVAARFGNGFCSWG